jgi:hypothetical protein
MSFAEEIQIKNEERVFLTATKFTNYRLRSRYFRPSPACQRGIRACPPESGYIDTSQMMANVRNLKICITDNEDAFNRLQANPYIYSEFVGDYQGVIGSHELNDDIFAFMADFMLDQ